MKTNPDWHFEGEVFATSLPSLVGTCTSWTSALYRLYNNGKGEAPNHRYTTSFDIRSKMVGKGWIPEGYGALGVIGCVPAP